MHDFRFVGFVERKAKQKKQQLRSLLQQTIPVVCFESPNRLLDTLRFMSELGTGSRMIFVARELTKLHEEKLFDSVDNLIESFGDRDRILGEIVFVISPAEQLHSPDVATLVELFNKERIPKSSSARLIAKLTGIARQEAYRRLSSSDGQDD